MHAIPVLFDPRQQAENTGSLSPSASKPAKAVRSWLDAGLPVEIKSFEPAPLALLRRVHDPAYVDGVLAGTRQNGFRNRNPSVAAALTWTNGSMIAAAREALRNGLVSCSPTSGFHHATRSHGAQYCTFNGLLAAVLAVTDDGFTSKVGILDLDAHWADGTIDILGAMPELAARVEHYTFGALGDCTPRGIGNWLTQLSAIVDGMASRCGLILFQAGADPHIDDPLGGIMTTEQLATRDVIVFAACARRRVPVAWNLAGGYQNPFQRVLDLHRTTMEACVAQYISDRNAPETPPLYQHHRYGGVQD